MKDLPGPGDFLTDTEMDDGKCETCCHEDCICESPLCAFCDTEHLPDDDCPSCERW